MSWFIYSLAVHDGVQDKCHEAMEGYTAPAEDSKWMLQMPPYVEATLRESMRRYPMLSRGSLRLVKQKNGLTLPLELLNMTDPNVPSRHPPFDREITLPCGTWCQVHFFNVMNGVDNWGETAKQFLPERFTPQGFYLGEQQRQQLTAEETAAAELTSAFQHTAAPNPLSGGATSKDLSFLPFSYGVRNCIGMNLALLEMKTVLLDLLPRFSFALANEALRDEGVALESVITLRPYKMLPVYVTKRG